MTFTEHQRIQLANTTQVTSSPSRKTLSGCRNRSNCAKVSTRLNLNISFRDNVSLASTAMRHSDKPGRHISSVFHTLARVNTSSYYWHLLTLVCCHVFTSSPQSHSWLWHGNSYFFPLPFAVIVPEGENNLLENNRTKRSQMLTLKNKQDIISFFLIVFTWPNK